MISAIAPAKINLFLHLLEKRDDGLHNIESLVVFTHKGDQLNIQSDPFLTLELKGIFADKLKDEKNNIVLRAARALAEASGRKAQLYISLEKNLPVSAGLGGGSSDAAVTLKMLKEQWQIDDDLFLFTLGRMLGADVPICLAQKTAYVKADGADISIVTKLPPLFILLLNPMIELKTKAVFHEFEKGQYKYAAPMAHLPLSFAHHDDLFGFLKTTQNDLTLPAINLVPEIQNCLEALIALPQQKFVRMSGSGASCFALFQAESDAIEAEKILKNQYPMWWSMVDMIKA